MLESSFCSSGQCFFSGRGSSKSPPSLEKYLARKRLCPGQQNQLSGIPFPRLLSMH